MKLSAQSGKKVHIDNDLSGNTASFTNITLDSISGGGGERIVFDTDVTYIKNFIDIDDVSHQRSAPAC